MKTFNINTHESGSFKYLGLEVEQTAEGVLIHQACYIPKIDPININKNCQTRRNDELTSEGVKKAEWTDDVG